MLSSSGLRAPARATPAPRTPATGCAPAKAARRRARTSASADRIPSGWCSARWPLTTRASSSGITPGARSATTGTPISGSNPPSAKAGSSSCDRCSLRFFQAIAILLIIEIVCGSIGGGRRAARGHVTRQPLLDRAIARIPSQIVELVLIGGFVEKLFATIRIPCLAPAVIANRMVAGPVSGHNRLVRRQVAIDLRPQTDPFIGAIGGKPAQVNQNRVQIQKTDPLRTRPAPLPHPRPGANQAHVRGSTPQP